MFDGYKSSGVPEQKRKEWEFGNLDNTPFLHGSEYLWELYHTAESEEEVLSVIRHMRRHETGGIETYDKVLGCCYGKLKKMEEGGA